MKTQAWSQCSPCGSGTAWFEGNCKALEATPAVAHAKKLQTIHHCSHCLFRGRLEHNGKQSRCSSEIPLPDLMAAVVAHCGVKDGFNFAPSAQPLCNLQRVALVPFQPYVKCAQPAQGQIHIIRTGK